jgi:uncharacterized protein (TIGR03083 family)
MNLLEHCDALEVEVELFASLLGNNPFTTQIPSCPGWSAHDLAEHLGTVHRWAEHLVRVQAPERIASDIMDFSRGPVSAAWVREGGAQLCATLRASDPNAPMWAWGEDQHVKFWSRRQLHETMVHRMDLELAMGASPACAPEIAADAIDELLMNLPGSVYFSPRVAQLRGDDQLLRMSMIDQEMSWTVILRPNGFELVTTDEPPTAEFVGLATDLLLLLYRRATISATNVKILGDVELAEFWLANSALE